MRRNNSRRGAPHLAPPAGRGRIASAIRVRGSLCDHGSNRVENTRQIAQNVVVPEMQDAIIVHDQPLVTNGVVLAFRVLPAINFDDEAGFATNKIDDVRTDRLLPDKLLSMELARSQTMPERRFRISRASPQTPSAPGSHLFGTTQVASPPHPARLRARRPLPASGARLSPSATA
jgi:hypothetical protein